MAQVSLYAWDDGVTWRCVAIFDRIRSVSFLLNQHSIIPSSFVNILTSSEAILIELNIIRSSFCMLHDPKNVILFYRNQWEFPMFPPKHWNSTVVVADDVDGLVVNIELVGTYYSIFRRTNDSPQIIALFIPRPAMKLNEDSPQCNVQTAHQTLWTLIWLIDFNVTVASNQVSSCCGCRSEPLTIPVDITAKSCLKSTCIGKILTIVGHMTISHCGLHVM